MPWVKNQCEEKSVTLMQ